MELADVVAGVAAAPDRRAGEQAILEVRQQPVLVDRGALGGPSAVSEKLLEKLVQNGEVDFACVRVGAKRFQVNAFRRRAGFRLDRHALHPVRAAEFSLRAPRAATSRLHSHVTAETFVEVLHQDNRSIINQH